MLTLVIINVIKIFEIYESYFLPIHLNLVSDGYKPDALRQVLCYHLEHAYKWVPVTLCNNVDSSFYLSA